MSNVPIDGHARALADRVLSGERPKSPEWRTAADGLTALALSDDRDIAATASHALFRDVVEYLADRFQPELSDLYVQFFSRVVAVSRRDSGLAAVDELLRSFGLKTGDDVLRRAEYVRRPAAFKASGRDAVRKVLVPGRVTLGADIAVTSVVLQKLKEVFPRAEVILLAGPKAGAFFASDPRVRLREISYARGGLLRDRLGAWPALVDLARQETAGLKPEEYIVVDPDSRLTQLGLLPLVPDDTCYFLFESRTFTSPGSTSLGDLTAKWLDGIFGAGPQRCLPYISLAEDDRRRGDDLRNAAGRPVAAINLGVGDNPAKRVSDPFEANLLSLLHSRGYAIVLDQGAGDEELAQTSRLIEQFRASGASVSQLNDGLSPIADLNVWQGSLSGFAGFIAAADLYVGYDSAGGHLAAALGVPGIDVFAGASSPRMLERWTPWGSAPASVVAVKPGQEPAAVLAALRERLP